MKINNIFTLVFCLGLAAADPLYEGCFTDEATRTLPKLASSKGEHASPKVCLDECIRIGYNVAGLQYKYECWCGNTVPYRRKVSDSECSFDCAKDSTVKCGAGWRNSIYTNNDPSEWNVSSWLPCSADCGEGLIMRTKWCQKEDNSCSHDGKTYKKGELAVETQPCVMEACKQEKTASGWWINLNEDWSSCTNHGSCKGKKMKTYICARDAGCKDIKSGSGEDLKKGDVTAQTINCFPNCK